MKKHTLVLLAAGSLIAFASSCNDGENNTTKEQVDSTVTARVDTMSTDMNAKNDSMINAMAQMRADSMMRADSIARVQSGAKKTGNVAAKAGTKTVKGTKGTNSGTTKDGRLDIDKDTKGNDGRLDIDKNPNSKEKKQDNDGRLKID